MHPTVPRSHRRRDPRGRTLALLPLLTLLAAAAPTPALAQPAADGRTATPLSWRIGVEELELPGGEDLGLVGTSVLAGFGNGWFAGPVIYSALTGQRGGLFVLGGDLLWRGSGPAGSRIEAGLAVGGGGGAAAPVGGGLMLRPHVEWSWPVGPAWLGVSASHVRFPSGNISSNQLGVVLSFDDRFLHTRAGAAPVALSADAPRSGFGFDRAWLSVGSYRVRGGQSYDFGGLRVEREIAPGIRAGLEGNGAAQGSADGYAELLGSLGVSWPLWRASGGMAAPEVGVRAALGAAGGGAVSTGGGALAKVAATLHWELPHDLLVGIEAGRVHALDGQLRANHVQLMLGMTLDRPYGSRRPAASAAGAGPRTDVVELAGSLSHFPRMRYRNGSTDAVETIGFRARRPLSPHLDDRLQLVGAVHFAAGGRAGAYGAGLVGLAYATPLQRDGWQFGAELTAGAAGGGGISTNGGAVIQPMVRVGHSSGGHGWQLGVGQLRSARGGLSTPVVELSYAVALGLPRR